MIIAEGMNKPHARGAIARFDRNTIEIRLLDDPASPWREPLSVILNQGNLSRRITEALGSDPSRQHIDAVYRRLCECRASGRMFSGL